MLDLLSGPAAKTEAIRRALAERHARLRVHVGEEGRSRLLESEVWSRAPEDQMGRPPDRAERERILGYGEHGV